MAERQQDKITGQVLRDLGRLEGSKTLETPKDDRRIHVAGFTRVQFLAELARTKSDAFVVDFEDLKRELSLG
jgi:hypothetical protein